MHPRERVLEFTLGTRDAVNHDIRVKELRYANVPKAWLAALDEAAGRSTVRSGGDPATSRSTRQWRFQLGPALPNGRP